MGELEDSSELNGSTSRLAELLFRSDLVGTGQQRVCIEGCDGR